MATNNDDSMLLGLPMELLQRITENLRAEVLTTLRLTCKTLESVVLERFIKQYCTQRQCFMLSVASWKKLQTQFKQCPRLTKNMRLLIITTKVFEDDSLFQSLLQLAPKRRFKNFREAQRGALEYARSDEGLSPWFEKDLRPDVAMMKDVLKQLRRRAKFASVIFDMELPVERYACCRDIFTAIASSKLAVSITIPDPFDVKSDALLAEHGTDSLSRTSALRSVNFGSRRYESPYPTSFEQERLVLGRKIIQSSTRLESLSLYLRKYHRLPQPEAITTGLLQGINLPTLERLDLGNASVTVDVLNDLLARCKGTLREITLSGVRLLPFGDGWREVFQTISAMPAVCVLSLVSLRTGPRQHMASLSFGALEHGHKFKVEGGGYSSIVLDGRRNVVAGIRQLLNKPLEYVS